MWLPSGAGGRGTLPVFLQPSSPFTFRHVHPKPAGEPSSRLLLEIIHHLVCIVRPITVIAFCIHMSGLPKMMTLTQPRLPRRTPPPPEPQADAPQDHFKDKPLREHGSLWDELWQQQRTTWDRGGPSLPLLHVFKCYPELFDGAYPDLGLLSDFVDHGPGQHASSPAAPATERRKKALVPACGRGYDATLLAIALGYDVVGLEISSSALDAARQYLDDVDEYFRACCKCQYGPPEYDEKLFFWIKNRHSDPGRVNWVCGDFFSDDWLADAGADQFDLIFDYTVRLSRFL